MSGDPCSVEMLVALHFRLVLSDIYLAPNTFCDTRPTKSVNGFTLGNTERELCSDATRKSQFMETAVIIEDLNI